MMFSEEESPAMTSFGSTPSTSAHRLRMSGMPTPPP